MALGGVETSVLHDTSFPQSADVDFLKREVDASEALYGPHFIARGWEPDEGMGSKGTRTKQSFVGASTRYAVMPAQPAGDERLRKCK